MDLYNNVSEKCTRDGSFLLNFSSVENAAKNINNRACKLGHNFKDEYKDLRSTIEVNRLIHDSFNNENLVRNELKLMSTEEYCNLLDLEDEWRNIDKRLKGLFELV